MFKKLLTNTAFGAALSLGLTIAILPVAAKADVVQLVAKDGSNSIAGCLLKFESDTYELETALGKLAVSAERFLCQGQVCPSGTTAIDGPINVERSEVSQLSCSWLGY